MSLAAYSTCHVTHWHQPKLFPSPGRSPSQPHMLPPRLALALLALLAAPASAGDGRFNKDNVRSLCMEAKEKGLLYVFIILDKYGLENNNSILNMNSVRHVYKLDGEYDIEVKPYLDDFPFSYYVIVEDSADLPEVIHTILVKWFTLNSCQ